MRRREVLAGVGSVGALAGAGAVAVFGMPSLGDDLESHEPMEVETAEAPGSEAGSILIPDPDEPTFVDIFGTWCTPCIEQMPALATAHERVGDEVTFVSVTSENVGPSGSVTEEELADWWAEHDGDWTIGLDRTAEITERYISGGYPSAAAIDASGRVRWSDDGVKTADELVAGIEKAIDPDDSLL